MVGDRGPYGGTWYPRRFAADRGGSAGPTGRGAAGTRAVMQAHLGKRFGAAILAAGLLGLGPSLARAQEPEAPPPAPVSDQVGSPPPAAAPASTEAPPTLAPTPAAEDPKRDDVPSYSFLEDRDALLAQWSQSGLVQRLELGTSAGGRELFGVQFGAPGGRPLEERATVLLVGGLDGVSLSGSQAVLSIVGALLAHPEGLPPEATFVAVPWANPDGLARWRSLACGGGRNDRGLDEDGDGQVDEDGPDDLDRDGLILEMLIEDPDGPWVRAADPRFLRRAREGEAPRYLRMREGRDDDGDGLFNEDGPGGVQLDHNFPVGWEDWKGVEAGPWPLSEPESGALAQLALTRRTAVVLVFQGNHGVLAGPGGRSVRSAQALAEDEPTYRRLVEVFTSHTGRAQAGALTLREAHGESWPGSLVDWSYSALGALSMEIGVWGPAVQATGHGPVDAYFRDPSQSELDPDEVAPAERAWAQWLDNTRGGIGFMDWQPVELEQKSGVWIGGWEPHTCFNPPVDVLPQALKGLDAFTLDLAKYLPRLDVDLREAKREGRVCLLKARVRNTGTLPSGVGPTSKASAVRLRLEIAAGVSKIAGELETTLGHLPGRGSSQEYSWLLTAPEGSVFRIVVESPWSPPSVREVRL